MRRAAWFAFALVLAAPAGGHAGEQRHVLASGESLEAIAARAYGNPELADWLAQQQGGSKRPRRGDEIRLPGADRHVAVAGDTWDALAERSLGSAALAEDLARLNGRAPGEPIRPGQQLRLPVLAPYRILPGDSLARVSRRFYATPELALLLARVNGLANAGHVVVGQTIRVPITHVVELEPAAAVAEVEPVAIAPVSAPPPSRPIPEFADALRAADEAYVDGRYDAALASLERLRADVLARGTPVEQSSLLRQLAFVYVAYDRSADACSAWRALRGVDGDTALDPNLVSPKIRDAVSGCR